MADLGFSTVSDIFSSLNSKGDVSIAYKTLANLFGKLASDDPVAYPERWGAVATANATTTDKKKNISALNKAYNYLVQQGGGTIQYKGYGPYDFGTLQVDDYGMLSGLNIATSNIRLCGTVGRIKSLLQFSTANVGSVGAGGALIYINSTSTGLPINSGGLRNIHFENLAIRDYNTVNGAGAVAGNPGMISGQVLADVSCRHLVLYNGKGNGTLNIFGDTPNPYSTGTGYALFDDIWCYAENIAAGLYCEGDWINTSGFNDITLLGIHVPFGGQNRIILEFGPGIGDIYIGFCDLNISPDGVLGLGSIGSTSCKRTITFAHNNVRNWLNSSFGVTFTPDIPGGGGPFPLHGVNIHDNVFSSTAGSAGVELGDSADWDTLRIERNLFDCGNPIYFSIASLPKQYVGVNHNKAPKAKNLIVTNANGTTNLGPAFPDSSTIFECTHNLVGAQPPGDVCKIVDLSTWKNIKSFQFKCHDNKLGINHEYNGQVDGKTFAQFVLGVGVANGADTPTFTATVLGVKATGLYPVKIFYGPVNTPPAGIFFHGHVTADDTVTYYGRNLSGAILPAGTYGIGIQVDSV